ncbi:MAG: 50S ribosomal protein L10 [candidate division WOR-3 bacterium]
MPKKEKVETVQKLKILLESATGIYFADCSRIKAKELSDLRHQLRTAAITTKVIKNRLAFLAFKELGFADSIRNFLTGPTALITTTQDPIKPARMLKDLMKKFTEIKIKGAYVEKTIFGAEQFGYLANLPTRPELETSLVTTLLQPLYGIVMALNGLLNNMVFTFEAISRKKTDESNLQKEQN